MSVKVNILFPSKPTGVERFDHEDDIAAFFHPLGEFLGFGTSGDSTDVSLGIPDGEDVKAWAARMCDTLRAAGAPAGTSLAIFPEDFFRDIWNSEWWRVDVFGPHCEDGPLMMRVRNDYDAPDGLVELGYV